MKILIDPKIEFGWVYLVKIKLTQFIGKSKAKEEKEHETSFNKKQPEVAISRAIKETELNADKIELVTITMIRPMSESCF